MTQLSNFTFDELFIGQTTHYTRQVTERDLQLFAAVSGDVNPLHLDEEFAAESQFGERIAHGMLSGAFISAAIALQLPGPGTIYLEQSLRFRLPVKLNDTLTVHLEVTEKTDRRRVVKLVCNIENQNGKRVAMGTADVIAPAEKIIVDRPKLPEITVHGLTDF